MDRLDWRGALKTMAGILITRGSRVTIPVGGLSLSIGDDGKLASSLRLQVSYDMHPQWLAIAVEHADRCAAAAQAVDALWTDGSRSEEITALEVELREGMQAVSAAAFAVDSFYATVKEITSIPEELTKQWKEKRTARYAQASEVFRLSFEMNEQSFSSIRETLKTLFGFRDQAVHPVASARDPVLHPRLNVHTERRLAIFSAANAIEATKIALKLIGMLIERPKPDKTELVEHCNIEKSFVHPIIDEWEARRGNIFERKSNPPQASESSGVSGAG